MYVDFQGAKRVERKNETNSERRLKYENEDVADRR